MMTIEQRAEGRDWWIKVLIPLIPMLLGAGILVGGMKWAVGSLERQVTQNLASCKQEDAELLYRLQEVERKQIDVLQRLSRLEARHDTQPN